jgi:hypothetical protein
MAVVIGFIGLEYLGFLLMHLQAREDLLLGETHFRSVGVFVGRGAITDGGDDGSGQTFRLQTETFIILRAIETFHGAGINPEQSGAGQEIAKRNVDLVARPGVPGRFIHALHDPAYQHATKAGQRFHGNTPQSGGVLNEGIDIGLVEIDFGGEDHQVRGVRDLGLTVRGRQEFGPNRRVGDDNEVPGLQSAAGWAEQQSVFEGGPVVPVYFALRVELFGGVAPVEPFHQLSRIYDVIHMCKMTSVARPG